MPIIECTDEKNGFKEIRRERGLSEPRFSERNKTTI
jgi:hypothetical protein